MHAIFNQLITKVRESIKGRPKTNKQTKKKKKTLPKDKHKN